MGQCFSDVYEKLSRWYEYEWNDNNLKILMIGPNASGKTTMLYNLKLNVVTSTTPTMGFNVETF